MGIVTFTKRLRGSDLTSRARRLRTGSSGLLFRASSLRSLARSQPPCTKVCLPSGRTSLTVTCRSTLGLEERIQAFTAPAPITVVLASSGLVRYDKAPPAGLCVHLYGGVAVHSPPSPPAVSPLKFVNGRAWASQVNESALARPGRRSASAPPRERYQVRPTVPGMGKLANECSKPGSGSPGLDPPAPLSNRTRMDGCCSNIASAPSYVGCSWIGSRGSVTPGTPIASW